MTSSPDSGTEPEGLRERKKRERGEALRRAARELTLEHGFDSVTIEDICTRCGVSRRTFFNYFRTKEEALFGPADTLFDAEDETAISAFESGGPHGRLLADLQHLLASIVRTRLHKREELHQLHRILHRDPALLQLQMSRMGGTDRRLGEIIQRRLEPQAPVSPRAETLAALSMMAIKASFTRLRHVDGDPAPVIDEIFDELRRTFQEETA